MLGRHTLAAAVISVAVMAAAQSTDQSAGHISALTNDTVIAHGPGKYSLRTQAAAGSPVAWQDQIQTNKNGRARIALNDGSLLTLGANSSLRVLKHEARTQQTDLELAFGRIRCQVASLTASGAHFELRTPTSVAGVIGTDFGADASVPGQTRYLCISGTTRIYTPNRSSYVDCGPGMSVVINASGRPGNPTTASLDQIERWKHITEPADPLYANTLAPFSSPQAAPAPTEWHGITFSGNWRLRSETWNWFRDGSASNLYNFSHSIFRFGLGHQGNRMDWQVELAQPSVLGAPNNAIAPAPQGQLGLGGTYYAANGNNSYAASAFPGKAFLRFKGFGANEDNQVTVGRFAFYDGNEVAPRNPTLAWLQAKRISQRLIGDFAFAVNPRSNDGAMLSLNRGPANLTFAAARPTRGVYQVDGLGELDVNLEYGAFTLATGGPKSAGELRVFGIGYQDQRADVKTDNRPLAVRSGPDLFSHINIGTVGFNYLQELETQDAGAFDLLVWAAGQTGDWGTQRHLAGAGTAEAGWQPPAPWLHPWFRLGYFASSGDGNPGDREHNTFFAILPTPRQYARFPLYNEENNTDAFAALLVRPNDRLNLQSEGHALWLTSRNDLWYQGGGAFQPRTFGYTGRPSGGNRGLGNLWDVSADYQISAHWGLGLYYGHLWGKGVMRGIYPAGPNADFGYSELLFRF